MGAMAIQVTMAVLLARRSLRPLLRSSLRVLGTVSLVAGVGLLAVLGLGPRTGQYRTLTVLTGSMEPTYPAGSVIVQTPLDLREVAVGDVITYRIPVEDRRVVTHRVVEIVEPGDQPVVVTKGDGNAEPDAWAAKLTGETTWKTRMGIPAVGHLFESLRSSDAQRVSTMVLPAFLALLWLKDIWSKPAGSDPDSDSDPAPSTVAGSTA